VPAPLPTTSVPVRKGAWGRQLLEWLVIVLFAMLIAAGLRVFVVQSFFVPTGSMVPTLQIGDRIIAVKIGYTIHRGDIIVFRRTPGDTTTTDSHLVKRVIGLPEETISSRGATVLIDGKPLKEPWLPALTSSCVESAETSRLRRSPLVITSSWVIAAETLSTADAGAQCQPRTSSAGSSSSCGGFGHPYFHWF